MSRQEVQRGGETAGVGKAPGLQHWNRVLQMSWPIERAPWWAWGQGVCAAGAGCSGPRQKKRGRRQYLAQPAEGYVEGQGEEVLYQLLKSFGQVLELLFLQAEPQQNPSCNAES